MENLYTTDTLAYTHHGFTHTVHVEVTVKLWPFSTKCKRPHFHRYFYMYSMHKTNNLAYKHFKPSLIHSIKGLHHKQHQQAQRSANELRLVHTGNQVWHRHEHK